MRFGPVRTGELESLRAIDRRDRSPAVLRVVDGRIVSENIQCDHPGFTSLDWDCHIHDFREGMEAGTYILFGAFQGAVPVGVAGLETGRWYGAAGDMLNMSPLWISQDRRRLGIGSRLLRMAANHARELGARALYVSSTPIPSTVDFYFHEGCLLLSSPDPVLFELEPEDVHMELPLGGRPVPHGSGGCPDPVEILECTGEGDFKEALLLTEDYLDWLDMDLSFQGIEEEMSSFPSVYGSPDGLFLLARTGTRTAGGVGLRKIEPGICEMKRLFVREEFRGAGLGRLLCRRLIARAEVMGYSAMRLDTLQKMEEAVSLYRSLGFHEIGPYRHNPDPTAKYMELELSRR